VILVQDEGADGNLATAAVAQRLNDGHVGPPGQIEAVPQAGRAIAPGGAHRAIQEGVDDPRVPADRRAAIAVAPPAL
jgi:hypothetical protein